MSSNPEKPNRSGMRGIKIVGIAITSLLLISAVALSGCGITTLASTADGFQIIAGSGNMITRDYDYSDFTAIHVSNAFRVEITQGDTYSVSVTADDNIIDHVEVSKPTDNSLKIAMKPGYSFNFDRLEARVTVPNLAKLSLAGACHGVINHFKSPFGFDLEVTGASSVTGHVEAADTNIIAAGASSITLDGSGRNLNLDVTGASRAQLEAYQVADAYAKLGGAGNATINANGKLDADLEGASSLKYEGNPSLGKVTTAGASSIHKR